MEEEVKAILDWLIKDIRKREELCVHQMAYMDEHKFKLEREAISYQQKAYNRCLHDAENARDQIVRLICEQ